eukprot:8880028-Alexandrium_andersonii.AAC.1
MVKQAFQAAADSAPGPDGWSNGDLKCLPQVAYDWLALLYNKVESGSAWPSAVLHARAAFIPKGETDNPLPLAHRVLTVASTVYRRWASLRLAHMEGW